MNVFFVLLLLLAWSIPTEEFVWTFQAVLHTPYTRKGLGSVPAYLTGRGFTSVISGYDRNKTGIYVTTNDDGYSYRGGSTWSQQQNLVSDSMQH